MMMKEKTEENSYALYTGCPKNDSCKFSAGIPLN